MAKIIEPERYYIAHLALIFITFVAVCALFFASLCLTRRCGDPARWFTLYLKTAFLAFGAFLFFRIITYAMSIASIHIDYDYGLSGGSSESLAHAQAQVAALSSLFGKITSSCIVLMLVSLASGIDLVRAGKPDAILKLARFASYGIAALIAVLTVATWALRVKIYADLYTSSGTDGDDAFDIGVHATRLELAICVILLVTSLAALALAAFVAARSRTEPQLKRSSIFLLACSLLWLVQITYDLASFLKEVWLLDVTDFPDDWYMEILSVIFGVWPVFILLCLLFSLGRMKSKGLWSTEQHFMDPSGYNWNATTQAYQQQPGWQYPQQGMQQQQQQPQGYYPSQQYPQAHQQQPYQQQAYQQQAYQQQPYQQQPQSGYPPTVQSKSPPPHAEAMGLNHQADGTPPQAATEPYAPK